MAEALATEPGKARPTPDQRPALGPLLVVLDRPVDGRRLQAAVEGLGGRTAGIVLLAVQPQIETVRSRGIMKEAVARRLAASAGDRLEPVRRAFAAAGMEAGALVRLTDQPAAIVDVAREHGCRMIVTAGPPLTGARRHWLNATGCVGHHLGARLAALSTIPVVNLPIGRGA